MPQISNTQNSAVNVFRLTEIDICDNRVQYIIAKDTILANYIRQKKRIEYYLSNNFNSLFVYTIIGQLISTKVANSIFAKFSQMCENDFSPNKILQFSQDNLRQLGMTYKKASYLLEFMQILNNQPKYLDKIAQLPDELAIKELTTLHGIGKWTAKMMLMFYFDRPNIVPVEDLAFVKGYNHLYNTNQTPAQIAKHFKKFEPYMSIASRYIYAYADDIFGNVPKL